MSGRPVTDDELRDLVDEAAIRRLLTAYADTVNRRAWPELGELFVPDVHVTVDVRVVEPFELHGPMAVGEFIGPRIEQFDFFEFVVLNARIDLRAGGELDAATARVFMQELRHDRVHGRWTTAYGLYRDEFARIDGRWWFTRRRYASLARTRADLEVFPLPE